MYHYYTMKKLIKLIGNKQNSVKQNVKMTDHKTNNQQ